jgi:hypothetical protein
VEYVRISYGRMFMALLKGSLPVIAVGIGAAIAAPMIIPALAAVGRPLAKGTIKGCLAVADYTREFFAEVTEQWGDLVAEVRSEATAVTAASETAASRSRAARA